MNKFNNMAITDINYLGKGVTRVDGVVTFVKNALKDEIVDIEITNKKKRYNEADAINIQKSSKYRTDFECPYYLECGGCDIGHMQYQYQLEFKKNRVEEALKKVLNIDIPVTNIIPSNKFNYRNKIVLRNNFGLGFYKKNSNEVVNIDKCLISNDKINNIIQVLNDYIKNNNPTSIEEVFIRSDDESMINILSKDNSSLKIVEFIKDKIEVNSIYFNGILKHGNKNITINLCNQHFIVSLYSFFQVNKLQTEKIYNLVLDYIKRDPNQTVLDLYCGVGTISCIISNYCKKVIGIELSRDAVKNAKHNSELNNINNVDFINGKVEDTIPNLKIKPDTIILDPPRSGTDSKTLNTILNLNPNNIIYISCNPETLAKDISELKDSYYIKEISIFDMFPNTNHVETVCMLKRR